VFQNLISEILKHAHVHTYTHTECQPSEPTFSLLNEGRYVLKAAGQFLNGYNDADYEIINQCWLRFADPDGGRIDRLQCRRSAVGMSLTGRRPSG
jgi:hypothetical protein